MGRHLSEHEKKALLEDYSKGVNAIEIAKKYGTSEGYIYKFASERKVKRGYDLPTETVPAAESTAEPAAPPPASGPTVAAPKAPPISAAILSHTPGTPCPLFPSTRVNQVDHLVLRRVIAEPPHEASRVGTGIVLENADPGLSEADIKACYGGGRYEVKAQNARGDVLATRVIRINGVRSKPFDTYDTSEDGGPGSAQFVPMPPMAGPANVVAGMMDKVMERLERRDEAINSRIEKLTDARQLESERMREMELRLMSESHTRQMEMIREMMGSRPQQKDPIEQLSTMVTLFKTMKEFASDAGDSDDRDPVTAAISSAPEIIGNLAQLIGAARGKAPLELEAPPSHSKPPAAPAPSQASVQTKPPADYTELAKALYYKLLADGVPAERAKLLVQQGFTMMDAEVQAAQKAKAVPKEPPSNGAIARPVPQIKPHPKPAETPKEGPQS